VVRLNLANQPFGFLVAAAAADLPRDLNAVFWFRVIVLGLVEPRRNRLHAHRLGEKQSRHRRVYGGHSTSVAFSVSRKGMGAALR
jgi:hypothetical protein